MSPVNNFAILALAASAMAIPQHGYQHKRFHGSASGSASAISRYSYSGSMRPHSYSGSMRPSKSGGKSSASAKVTAPAGYTSIERPAAPSTISAADVASSATSTCTEEVTITTIENVTVYVTESTGAPASSSESAAAVTTSATSSKEVITSSSSSSSAEMSLAATAAHYGGWGDYSGWQHESASTEAAAPTTSSAAAPTTYQATTFSSQAVPATTAPTGTYVASTSTWSVAVPTIVVPSVIAPSVIPSIISSVVSSVVSVATSAAAAPAPSSYGSASSHTGKRGLAYNDASLTECFAGSSEISWAYNWGSAVNGTLPSGITYIPTLWSVTDDYTKYWDANVKTAIDNGAKTLFSFNEPDQEGQANIPVATAVAAYKQWMEPYQKQASLCAPAVTNGGGSMGLSYLSSFLAACPNCKIDCLNIHWYDSATNIDYFKKHIQDTIALAGGKPIYVTEFGATGTDAQIAAFLAEVMPYMDAIDQIAGYAYFMVEQGVLVNNNAPSTYGKTYMATN